MLSLKTVGRRFETEAEIIAGGSGKVRGIITETDQNQAPSYIFIAPRHIFRTRWPTPVRPGMVMQTEASGLFILGDNGPSERSEGVLFQSFRMFQVTHKLRWQRRGRILDPITRLETEGVQQDLGDIYVAIEPTDREELDRRIAMSAEKARILTGVAIQADDMVGDYKVVRADVQLGIRVGMLEY